MGDDIYRELARVLDTLPNGFPQTEDGVEIRILKKIFQPEEAELFGHLRLRFETPEQIAERTGRPLETIGLLLSRMWKKGQIFGVRLGEAQLYKMLPWAFGIYEFQLPHMDREFAELCEAYNPVYGKAFFSRGPQLMHVVPVEREIAARQEALPYESVSAIIDKGQAFLLNPCICKKERGLLDAPCKKPVDVCLGIAPVPGVFDNTPVGRAITREEAYAVLERAEEAALVHLTWNVQNGHFFICNCCGCCCGVLRAINEMEIPASRVVNSSYVARIDPDLCVSCGTCADARCQVRAIEERDGVMTVNPDRCIGCGLCVPTCPTEAIHLERKPPEALNAPPEDEMAWYDMRGRLRGVDFSAYR